VTLGDPSFEPVLGAKADFGRLGGTVYRIEVPRNWNGRLLLFMHGYQELGPEASTTSPDARRYLIGHGIAWGASSFSSTSQIPGRAADETAALWDHFARTYGRPTRTYITGFSMGGMATHIAAERYPDRFDGALALCGAAGLTPGDGDVAQFFVAGAYVAGVTQEEFDATRDFGALVRDRILPVLQDPAKHAEFEKILVDLTGGPRAFAREGIHLEEETNWRRAEQVVAVGIAPPRETPYRLGPTSTVSSRTFNRGAITLPTDPVLLQRFVDGNDLTGELRMPMISLHSTGDGQVPIHQARVLRELVDNAGASDLLVQRVIRDPGHCGFTTTEAESSLEDLIAWVERGVKPTGMNVLESWGSLGDRYALTPRVGTPEANRVPGAHDRVVMSGELTIDGKPFDARFLGATLVRDGLVTFCQYTLSSVDDGRYRITVLADSEAMGCGARGARVVLWTFADDQQLYSRKTLRWPGDGRTISFDTDFSTSAPDGAVPETVGFVGEAYDANAEHLPGGARVEAYVGTTRCGIASVRRTGSFSGYSIAVVGPDSIPGCDRGAELTFRINGKPSVDTRPNDDGIKRTLDVSLR
jgi:pimeloyl-ACP methyl ester carboxylesterase